MGAVFVLARLFQTAQSDGVNEQTIDDRSGGDVPKSTRNAGKRWTPADVGEVKQLAREHAPARMIGLALGRTEQAVRAKASQEGISLRPSNQAPDNRRRP